MMTELKITEPKKLLVMVFFMISIISSAQLATINSDAREKLERSLLTALGLQKRPIVDKGKAYIPQTLIDLYKNTTNYEYESIFLPVPGKLTSSVNTVRSYLHQESSIDQRFPHNHKFRLKFDISNHPHHEIVTSAELKLSVISEESKNDQQRIFVYDIIQPGIKGKSKPLLRLVDSKVINTLKHKENSVHFDVLPVVDRWLLNRERNFGILIDIKSMTGENCKSKNIRLKRSLEEENWESVQPLLLLYSDDTRISRNLKSNNLTKLKRRKRNSFHKHRRRSKDECRRYPMYVDFEKVGFSDWIKAPPGYDAFFCAGYCPSQFDDHLNTTNHAVVQSLVHTVYPFTVPRPCCVPTSLAPITMLYMNEQNIAVVKTYPDMIVTGCGCR